MKEDKDRRFREVTDTPAQDFSEGTPEEVIEISYGKDVLREWIKVARHWMPDRDVKAILVEASEISTLHQ